jgi:penicillin-binding protein 1A
VAKKRQRRIPWLDIFLFTILFVALAAGGFAVYMVSKAYENLPALANLEPKPSETSFVYDRNGNLWKELHSTENRVVVDLKDLPQHFKDAVLAAEDHRFYSHVGVDLRAIARALFLIVTGRDFQGGSTITQQLAKKAFLTDAQTWTRKLQDAMLALKLERQFTKDEILEMYVNIVPYGRGAYGPEAAAKAFFGKSIRDITVDEAAFLAGMINGPYLYDPADNPQGALTKRNQVLDQMAAYGFISPEEAAEYKQVPLQTLERGASEPVEGGYFLDYVLKQLLSRYPSEKVYGGGLRIYTTYDPDAQRAVDKAISETLDPDFPYVDADSMQAAAIVLDADTGHILAMSGGRKHEGMLAWNRAVDTKRQPGSAFKPLAVYVPALEAGITPTTFVEDTPVTWTDPITGEEFSPRNYSGTFSGVPVTVRYAVQESLNVIACKVQDMIGIPNSLETAEKMGITSLVKERTPDGRNDYTRSLALGGLTYGVSPLDMAVAYATLANRGIRVEPIAILRVEDKDGNLLEEHNTRRTLAISEETAFLMTSMLENVIRNGTGQAANIGKPAAGKTGTTSDWKDAWFAGYTPNTVGIVWMGFDQEKTMAQWKITGGSYPARIWNKMMKEICKDETATFTPPPGIISLKICKKTALMPGPYCPAEDIYTEYFIKNQTPTGICFHDRAVIHHPYIDPEPESQIEPEPESGF